MTSGCICKNGAPTQVLRKMRILTKFLLCYTMRECKNEENANFAQSVYLLVNLCNIFDEAFLVTSVYNLNIPSRASK